MACHCRCPHLFVSGQMLSEKGRAFPKARARPIDTHPLSHNYLLQKSFCPHFLLSPPFPLTQRDEERNKTDSNWKWLGKPWKHTLRLCPPPAEFISSRFCAAARCAHYAKGAAGHREQKTPSCMKSSAVQQNAGLVSQNERGLPATLWSGGLQLR